MFVGFRTGHRRHVLRALAGAAVVAGCALEPTVQSGSGSNTSTTDTSTTADAGILGADCGVESGTGAVLCRAVSTCPSVIVDTQATPHCGFRIRGSIAELVCGCGDSICPMGTFTTCDQAQHLLSTQTELGVCAQVAEERCEPAGAASPPPASTGTAGNSNSGPTCDKQCLSECGGGAACASICECN